VGKTGEGGEVLNSPRKICALVITVLVGTAFWGVVSKQASSDHIAAAGGQSTLPRCVPSEIVVRESAENGQPLSNLVTQTVIEVNSPATVVVITSADLTGQPHKIVFATSPIPDDAARGAALRTVPTARADAPVLDGLIVRKASRSVPPALPNGVRPSNHGNVDSRPAMHRRVLIPRFHLKHTASEARLASLAHVSERVAVYSTGGDQSCDDLPLAIKICRLLESGLLDAVSGLLHPLADLDEDGRLNIVLCEMDDRMGTTAHSPDTAQPVRGCVRAEDWLQQSGDFAGDLIYLDRRLNVDSRLSELLAHELAHAAVCSGWLAQHAVDFVSTGDQAPIPNWLNEAIAHTVERQLATAQGNFQPRLENFLRDPGHSPVMPNDLTTTLATRRAGPRAAATLFVDLLRAKHMTLCQLSQPCVKPVSRMERHTGMTIAELLSEWAVAIASQTCFDAATGPDRRMAIVSVGDASPTVYEIHGTAMLCLKPVAVPCYLKVTAAHSARLSTALVTCERIAAHRNWRGPANHQRKRIRSSADTASIRHSRL
jgi:hypothetical protein